LKRLIAIAPENRGLLMINDLHRKSYEAVLDAAKWQGVLDELANAAGARGAALIMRELGSPELPYEVSSLCTRYKNFAQTAAGRHYLAELSRYEEPEWQGISGLAPGEVWVDTDLGCSLAELYARPDVACMREHINVARRIGFRLNDNKAWFDTITLGFGEECLSIPPTAFETMNNAWPHLAKSLELTRTFSMLRSRYQAVLSVLDRISIPILILSPKGEVLVSNILADALLDSADALCLDTFRHLRCHDADRSRELHHAISEVSMTASGKGSLREKLMQLPRRSGGADLLIDIAPIAECGEQMGHSLEGCLIAVTDPDRPLAFDRNRFGDLYGLTHAEREVCELVVFGNTAQEVAEIRQVRLDTAKNQIRAVMLKTDSRSRVHLLRKVCQAAPPIF
jgi:DNA-binding CsgD family transcriptional regulator